MGSIRVLRVVVVAAMPLVASQVFALQWKPDGPHAPYYSGTNCKYSVACAPDRFESGIVAFKILLNGNELVNESVTASQPPMRAAGKSITFDSSHFGSGTSLTFTSKAKVRYPGGAESIWLDGPTWTAPVKNKYSLMVSNRPPFNTIVGGSTYSRAISMFAAKNMGLMNYVSNLTMANQRWSANTFLNSLSGCNVAIISTHGAANQAAMEDSEKGALSITPSAILTARIKQLGTGQPPLNSTGNPPLNLFLMLACRQGLFTDWQNALYTAYADNKNQCVVGFNPFINLSCSVAMSTTFLEYLQEGWPVAAANVGTVDSYGPASQNIKLVSDTVGPDGMAGAGLRYLDVTDMAIMGDPRTRTHNVYLDDLTQSTGWYRL